MYTCICRIGHVHLSLLVISQITKFWELCLQQCHIDLMHCDNYNGSAILFKLATVTIPDEHVHMYMY